MSLFQSMTILLAASAHHYSRPALRRHIGELYEALQLVRSYSMHKRALYGSVVDWPSNALRAQWLQGIARMDAFAGELRRALDWAARRTVRRRRRTGQRCYRLTARVARRRRCTGRAR